MKINKREKLLLIILIFVLIAFVYYMFFVKKHSEKIKQLELEKQTQEELNETLKRKIISAIDLDKNIDKYENSNKKLSRDKYSQIIQENQVVLIKRLARDTGVKILAMDFVESQNNLSDFVQIEPDNTDENRDGQTKDSKINKLTANIKFNANYEQIDKYLKNIQNYEKKLVVNELVFESNKEGNANGSMKVNFYGINDLDGLVDKNEANYFKDTYVRNDPKSAYVPYAGYVDFRTINSIDEGQSSSDFSLNDSVSLDNPFSDSLGSKKVVRLDSFEKFDVFFLGSSPDVYGKVRLSSLSNDKSTSLKINYDFFNPAVTNRASIIFDKNKKIIYEPISSINLDAYLEQSFGDNKLGFTIMDSAGEDFDFYFDNTSLKGEWLKLSKTLDPELKYPVMLKCIFVEGDELYQSVKGEVFIDKLNYVAE